MTPEAQAFIGQTVQKYKEVMSSPGYQLLVIDGIDSSGSAAYAMHQFCLLQVRAVLLPKPIVTTAFYLDDSAVRELLATEQETSAFDVYHQADLGAWGALFPTRGTVGGHRAYGRRYYTIGKDHYLGWGLNLVPNEDERDADGSQYAPTTVVLPDFETVTTKMIFQAMGY